MPFDLEDYNRWADEFRIDGGEPSIKQYLKHLIYKEANSEGKHIKNGSATITMMERTE